MFIVHIIIAALATWQVIEIWHHGSIFATWRARVENWEGFFGDLLSCPFCLSVWVAMVLLIELFVADWLLNHSYEFVGKVIQLPVLALTVSRIANALNDVFKLARELIARDKRFCRTPGSGDDYADRPADEEKENLDE